MKFASVSISFLEMRRYGRAAFDSPNEGRQDVFFTTAHLLRILRYMSSWYKSVRPSAIMTGAHPISYHPVWHGTPLIFHSLQNRFEDTHRSICHMGFGVLVRFRVERQCGSPLRHVSSSQEITLRQCLGTFPGCVRSYAQFAITLAKNNYISSEAMTLYC